MKKGNLHPSIIANRAKRKQHTCQWNIYQHRRNMWKRSKGQTKEKITPSSKRSSIANIVVSEHAAPCRPGTHTLLCWIFLAHNGGFWLTHSCVGWDLHFTVDLRTKPQSSVKVKFYNWNLACLPWILPALPHAQAGSYDPLHVEMNLELFFFK